MTAEHTQHQSSEEKRQAKDLSLKSTTPPIEVPGYEMQKILGSGAFGEVWTGIDQNTGRRVAIKFYTRSGGVDWTLLSREVEKLAVLAADRYVVQLLDVGWQSDPPYYVMDYIENGSLEDLLQKRGTLRLHDAVEIFHEVGVGLMHLHGKGVLHCDLKPANVLLDEDEKPRLADFGQSRLTNEQKPALGTLFYMAPEQADLEAVPDARWDVYALGALLYCMLVGQPPFRSDELMADIDSTLNLPVRLEKYRDAIQSAPAPTEHRQVPGIDRSLVEIIDHCLIVDPDDRVPSVQSVLEALRSREEARVRTPLLWTGFVAPIVMLLIMIWFGRTGYKTAVGESDSAVSMRVQENNDTYALSVARAIEAEIPRYFQAVERESRRVGFRELFDKVRMNPMLEELKVSKSRAEEIEATRQKFLANSQRNELKSYMQDRLDAYLDHVKQYEGESDHYGQPPLKFASVFTTDANGTILAVAYDDPNTPSNSEGKNYAYRTYYHGGSIDLPTTTSPGDVEPIVATHLSTVFRSTTTKTWKIGVSTPIYDRMNGDQSSPDGPKLLGIMVMTIHLGDFSPFRERDANHFAVLVDNRRGENRGTILHHDFYRPENAKNLEKPFHVDLDQFDKQRATEEENSLFFYYDPLAKANGGSAYEGKWIAAREWVHLPKGGQTDSLSSVPTQPDLAVVVQENYDKTVEPVERLGRELLWRTSVAAIVFVLVICVQWYFVLRMLGGLRRPTDRHSPDPQATDSIHSMKTITAPGR